jgi:glycine dehydrogenase subunit 2
MAEKLIFEKGSSGRSAFSLPELDTPETTLPEGLLRQEPLRLPEVSEPEVVRHYTNLSRLNYGLDQGFYPLGSCTMKYNPKINELLAAMPAFTGVHPYQQEKYAQGCLRLLYELQDMLAGITGMKAMTLQPAAGAHGELTGMLMVKAYYEALGQARGRVIVPDSAHGTNPATAAMCGFEVVEVASNARGGVDMAALDKLMDDNTAAIMLTNPNTLGLFEEEILAIADLVHGRGGQLYYDGANLNAIMGWARPGDMGFDVIHLNLHKTFATPHGGGGPGAGPVGVAEHLIPFLPVPVVSRGSEGYELDYKRPQSTGRVRSFICNFTVCLKAYAYILSMGSDGLRQAAADAVLNANYLQERLKESYNLPYDRRCMHEFVLSALRQKEENGVRAIDIAKRLIDYGYHPPTMYFPLIVQEALMIEPTESESLEGLNAFVEAMLKISEEAEENPDLLRTAPHVTPISRPDETRAARQPNICLD